jgi:hypothetical protein
MFAHSEQLRDIDLAEMGHEMFHQPFRLVLGKEMAQFSVDPDMGSFTLHAFLQQFDHMFGTAFVLVVDNDLFEMVRVDDDVQTCDTRQAELLRIHTRETEFLPGLGTVGFLGGVNGLLVLSEADQTRGDLGVVLHIDE